MTESSASREETPGGGDLANDRRTTDFGVVCSQRAEIRGLLKHLDRQRKYVEDGITFRGGFIRESIRVAVVEAGNGFARNRRATEILIREHKPKWVFSVGFSSALDVSIRPGDIVLSDFMQDEHGNSLEVPCRIPASKRVHVGRWIIPDQHPFRIADKQALAESSDSIAVDTVSLSVAQVCAAESTPFQGIRAVIDAAGEEMPELASDLLFRPSGKAWGGALGGVVKSLRKASVLNEWRKRSVEAADHLGMYTGTLIVRISEQLNL